jgi:hypothetical protein
MWLKIGTCGGGGGSCKRYNETLDLINAGNLLTVSFSIRTLLHGVCSFFRVETVLEYVAAEAKTGDQ